MDYESSTLASAERNRDASRKLFHQWMSQYAPLAAKQQLHSVLATAQQQQWAAQQQSKRHCAGQVFIEVGNPSRELMRWIAMHSQQLPPYHFPTYAHDPLREWDKRVE